MSKTGNKKRALEALVHEYPKDLLVRHETVGQVFVSKHAWERFITRFLLSNKMMCTYFVPSQSWVSETLAEAFKRSRPVNIDLRSKISRLSNHRYIEAIYLYDAKLRARFIVTENDGRPTALVTVEQVQH